MVDSTSTQNLGNQDIATAENPFRINKTANKWWNNMLAVVKLRQKGTTMVSKLPGGVFRHMLEYEYPNEFSFRYSKPYLPISKVQDRKFPQTDKLDYNNCMVGIEDSLNGWCEYRMILKDKKTCNTQAFN